MTLYKFVARCHMEAFFKTGSLKIGTCVDFNDADKHGKSRGDPDDGAASLYRSVGAPVMATANEPLISEFFVGDDVTVNGICFVSQRRSSDAYVFCASDAFSDAAFQRYAAEFGADACYVVDEPGPFFYLVNLKLERSSKWLGVYPLSLRRR